MSREVIIFLLMTDNSVRFIKNSKFAANEK